jgi:uncharacterized protein involved in exopolysaccharide biosynthesis
MRAVNMTEPIASANDDGMSLLDLLVVLAENTKLLIVIPIVAGLAALGIAFLITPTFTATTKILPPQQQQGAAAALASQLGALAGLGGTAGVGIRNPADTYVALLRSRTVEDRLVDRFNLLNVYGQTLRQDARNTLEAATKIAAGKDGLITIDVDDKDPKRAADLANAYVEELYKLTGTLAITEAQQRRVFFEKQLQQTQEHLKNAQAALSQARIGQSVINTAPQAVVEGVARLKAQVTAQEIRLSTMRGYLTESSPEFQLAQRELASLRTQLMQAERDQPSKGGAAPDYLNRFRDFKYQETLFDLMTKQYELARLDEAREGAAIQVIDPAQPPEWKSKPKKASIAVLTTLAAFLICVFFVLVRHAIRTLAKEQDSAEKLRRIVRLLSLRRQ